MKNSEVIYLAWVISTCACQIQLQVLVREIQCEMGQVCTAVKCIILN